MRMTVFHLSLMILALVGHCEAFAVQGLGLRLPIAKASNCHYAACKTRKASSMSEMRMNNENSQTKVTSGGYIENETEAAFQVTWEHEDGSIDSGIAIRLIDSKIPTGRWRSGSQISDGYTVQDATEQHKKDQTSPNPFQRLLKAMQNFFGGTKMDKSKLAALGANAILSYGFISNISYATCLIAAWVVFGKRTALSPLAPGQNVVRPARFALSVALTPFFERLVLFIQSQVNKAVAMGITVFLVNVCGTLSFLSLGLVLATRIAAWASESSSRPASQECHCSLAQAASSLPPAGNSDQPEHVTQCPNMKFQVSVLRHRRRPRQIIFGSSC